MLDRPKNRHDQRRYIPQTFNTPDRTAMYLNLLKTTNDLFRLFGLFFLGVVIAIAPLTNASAQKKRSSLPWVRDAEIETLIKDYTDPLFQAAGMKRNAIEVFLLNRNEFNAFVTGTRMFINIGAIAQADTPNEIIGVFAHETGHILGGHLTGLRDRLEKAQAMAVLTALAGIGIGAAGGNSSAGAAVLLGGQQAITRGLLSYQREDELAADRTGVTLLNKSGQSSLGMVNTFRRLSKNSLFSSGGLDPYAISHPLPRERVALLKTVAEESPHYHKKDSPNLQLRHDMARGKIAAYSGGPGAVRATFRKNLNSAPARYGYAIATYLSGSNSKAVRQLDKLIKEQPNNPFLYEMKGEILLSAGNARAAVAQYSKAVSLNKQRTGLLLIGLGHALLETNDPSNLNAAIKNLKAGISRDKYSSRGYGYMARAHALQGNEILAIASSAEEKFLNGRFQDAKQFALRAQPKVKNGSPQWLRLQDIIDYKPKKLR